MLAGRLCIGTTFAPATPAETSKVTHVIVVIRVVVAATRTATRGETRGAVGETREFAEEVIKAWGTWTNNTEIELSDVLWYVRSTAMLLADTQ